MTSSAGGDAVGDRTDHMICTATATSSSTSSMRSAHYCDYHDYQ